MTVREETDLWKENPWMLGKLNIEEGIEMAKKTVSSQWSEKLFVCF